MKPIRDNVIVKPIEKKLDLDALDTLQSTFWVVVDKGEKCGDEYNVGDTIEAFVHEELPRCTRDGTFIIKDNVVLGVKK